MRTLRRGVGLGGLLMFGSNLLWGQITTGTISGTVKDSSGAVLPGTTVQIQNIDTGLGRTVTTDSRGYYNAPNLSLGKVEATASLSGFQTEVRRGITLNVGQNAVIDFTLRVGAVTERVEVTAEAPLIETTTSSVAGLINERQVQDLPMNARNLIDLAHAFAGVAFANTGERSASKGMATKLTISGTRYNASLFQLDGVDINDTAGSAGGAAGILMGVETIREFNVITSGYSAEYGKHTGGVFNAVTKSGTNTLHGSVFDFLRNDKLDARNFFDVIPGDLNRSNPPPYKRNQFGGSLGGPIIPDRSFYFGSYEGLRERLGRTNTFLVPSLDVRQGRLPGQANPVTISSAVRPFLDSYPLPNGKDLGDGTAEYIVSRGLPTNEDFFTVRLDHKFSDSDSTFGRYTFDDADNTPNTSLNTSTVNVSRSHYAAIGETRVFSPAVINQFLAGFSRSGIGQFNGLIPGLPLPVESFTGRPGVIGQISVRGGLASWGGGITFPRNYLDNMFQFKDDVFYTRGSHSFKFGFNAQRYQFNHTEFFNGGGNFSFNSISDFLQGIVNTYNALTASSDATNYVRQTIYGLYVQDDYRLSSRLTLNLGLRYEFTTVPVDKFGRVGNLLDFYTPGQTPDKIIYGNPHFLNPSLKNFAPRVGFAWDPTGSGKTSIRAGAGIFHEQINAGGFVFAMLSTPPFYVVGNILNIPGRERASFPDAFFTQQAQLASSGNIEGYQYKADQPAVYKYGLDLQREVLPDTSVDVGFSATRGVHLQRVLLMNALVSQVREGRRFFASNAPLLHPAFGRIRPRFTDVTSSYYALRLSVTRRFSRGLQAQGSYTWSKTLDDGSNWTGNTDWSNGGAFSRYLDIKDKGPASFDLRHSFGANFTYELPGRQLTGAAAKILGGWQVSAILSLQSGNPFNVTTGVSPSFMNAGFIGDYPDLAPGVSKFKYNTRNPDGYKINTGVPGYFNPSAFVLPPGFSNTAVLGGAFLGNAGRSILTAPGIAKFDIVLVKMTPLTERVNLQFRSEFFNLFNRANFSLPEGRVFQNAAGALSGSVGKITNTTTSSRQIQFGMRLVF